MPVAKRKGKARENRTKEDPRTGVSNSGGTNSPGGGKKKKTYKKRSQRAGGLSLALSLTLSLSLSLFSSCLLGHHALTPRGCIFLYFLNKTELKHRPVTLICLRAVTPISLRAVTLICLRVVIWSVQGL